MKLKEWMHIERDFFTLDEEKKMAKIVLRYERPEALFEPNCVSKTPILSLETMAQIQNVFALVPPKYKVDLTLQFDDLGPHTEEELTDIVVKNFVLELKSKEAATEKRNKLAYGFLTAGVLIFLLAFMIHYLWSSGSIWSELLFYLLDLTTTVFLYEAVTILGLERKEKLSAIKKMHDSFSAIHFTKSEA